MRAFRRYRRVDQLRDPLEVGCLRLALPSVDKREVASGRIVTWAATNHVEYDIR